MGTMKPKLARKQEPHYFIRGAAGSEQGPLSLDALRAMARNREISPDTEFRREEESDFRPLAEEPIMVADLWPEEDPFDPALLAGQAQEEEPPPGGEESPADASGILEENVERERRARAISEIEEEQDWKTALPLLLPVVRWVVAAVLTGIGFWIWLFRTPEGTGAVTGFVFGLLFIIPAILLVSIDLARLAAAPFSSLMTVLLEGTGGGAKADYWTANSLMEQGEYQMAMSEYRKIVLQHPREIEAYLQGIRAARALGNEREADRFRDLALKGLKSEQDRNLFLSSLERMKTS